jgi:hypothetical protein
MSTNLITVNFLFYSSVLSFQYLNKGKVQEAEIVSVFTTHLGLRIGKVSLSFATSIEHGWSSLYRAVLRGDLASNKHTITSLLIYSSNKSVKNPLLFMIIIIVSIEIKISVGS